MNILLVAIDTLRADHLDCYGYCKKTSPTLSKLAKEGVLFENFFAPTIPTHPSFTSYFTSVDAYGHQVVNVAGKHEMSSKYKTIAQVLKANGYFTVAVDNLQKHYAWGYDVYENYPPTIIDREKRIKRHAEGVNEKALPLVEQLVGKKNFFFYVHYWDPHTPYWPPMAYDRMFYDKPEGSERDKKNLSMRAVYAFDGFRNNYISWMGSNLTDADYVIAQYDGEIAYNNVHLAKLFNKMKRRKVWENTLVIVFSDHGEILDDHTGQFDHHGLYDGNLHVPLIIRFPRGKYAGKRVDALTANVDLAPTILEIAGIEKPKQMEGESLMPLIRGERTEQYSELYLGEATWQCKRGVRTKEWKLIRALSTSPRHNWHGEGRYELYNLMMDPLEQTNLINVRPRVAKELERRLDKWLDHQKKKYRHDDPIKVQGTSLGRKALADARKRDLESNEPIR